jgi:predicted alpha-1,2-mannosidase
MENLFPTTETRMRALTRPRTSVAALAISLVCALGSPTSAARTDSTDLTQYVDPFIGTLGSGFVFPGPAAPYGMVQLSPDTEGYLAYTGYMYNDSFIRGFSHVHVQSMGVREGGNLPFMPTTGPIVSTDAKRYQSKFTHATEEASPGYYKVGLDTYGITAELTSGLRVGMHRYTFPPAGQANVMLDIGRQIPGGPDDDVQRTDGQYRATAEILPDSRTVVGTANPDLEGPQRYAVHFAARFDRPFTAHGVWPSRGAATQPGVTTVSGRGAGAYVSFDPSADRDVVVKVGISFVSRANALENLESELPGADFGFDALRERTRAAWDQALHTIEVSGGLDTDLTSFYTALYHAQHHPNVFNDANGEYLGYDGAVHRIGEPGDPMPEGSTHYANFSFWDTYRGEMQLLALVAPQRFRDMMRSLVAISRWGGRLPRWGLMNRYADYMNGEPALPVIADGFCRGLVPDDVAEELYQEARHLALVEHRDPSYLDKGYIPFDVQGSGASGTLEHALADFGLALVADRLGRVEDRDRLLELAGNWRNHLDPETRFMRPRLSDGSWMTPYQPELPDGFREGTGWQYTWLVPHDVSGLFDRMGVDRGGDAFVTERLDTFFSTALTGNVPLLMPEVQQKATLYGIAYYGNQYAPSNEHDLQAPYLHQWLDQQEKTQELSRAYQGLFRAAPDGLPGNDDLGSMSAWYVWSALGFYPVIAGAPVYVMGSPVFERAEIDVPNGSFVVEAPEASIVNKYVNGAALDQDETWSGTWFTHDRLIDGGSLRLDMGPVSTRTHDVDPGRVPPSASASPIEDFGCRAA